VSYPHVRGLSRTAIMKNIMSKVLPACAGINEVSQASSSMHLCLTRMCGDYRLYRFQYPSMSMSYPHVRGLTASDFKIERRTKVLPACAGIIGFLRKLACARRSLTRVCGD